MPRAFVGNDAKYSREELTDVCPLYDTIDDCLNGSIAVKKRRQKYLPMPNAADQSAGNIARYNAYLTRAVFYNVSRRTLNGFVGELFDTDPQIVVPPAMEDLVQDATGDGVSLVQQAKSVARLALSLGRSGLYVDYPTTSGAVSQADIEQGVRPIIRHYHPRDILNWRYKKVGALKKLCLVVVREYYDKPGDSFQTEKGEQWRILRLSNTNVYTVELWKDATGQVNVNEDGAALPGLTVPTDGNGKPFDTIPFTFVGAETNDATIDYPPLFDLCDLNMGHYRNSADFEEATYMCSQPTPVITGLTEDWMTKYYAKGLPLGSRAVVALPVGATAELLEMRETSQALIAMQEKEKQMVALGAKLVEQKEVQRTATEASLEVAAETSTLANVSANVSTAFEWALGFAAQFMKLSDDKIVFQLNKEFNVAFADPLSRAEVIDAWVAGAISRTEMRTALRKGGVATLSDEDAKEEMDADDPPPTSPGGTNALPGAHGFDENGQPLDPNVGDPSKGKKKPGNKSVEE